MGALIFLLFISFYVLGSYTEYVLWFHFFSLVLFVAAYLTLRISFNITRILFVPLAALVFVIPPPIQGRSINAGVFGAWDITSIIASATIFILLAYILKPSRSSKQVIGGVNPCPVCQSYKKRRKTFCPHCGKLYLRPASKSVKFELTTFFVLLVMVSSLVFVSVPVFSFADKDAAIAFYAPRGREDQSILLTPPGLVLESTERQSDYENQYLQDYVVLNSYSSEKYAENKSHVLLEVSVEKPHWMDAWQLPNWTRRWETMWLKNVMGTYVALQRENETKIVLFWETPLLFNVDSVYLIKRVGVSIYMNFTESIDIYNPKIIVEMQNMATFIIESWRTPGQWTLHASTLSRINSLYRDVFLSVASIVGVLSLANWARTKDEEVEKSIENAFLLLEQDAPLLVAISRMKSRRFTGAKLFEYYKQIAETKESHYQFYEKLDELSRFGLLKTAYILNGQDILMVWERRIPRI